MTQTNSENVFKARTLAVIDDFSLDERLYLFDKARELKEAMQKKDKKLLDQFRINDPDFGIYKAFIEDSTRTNHSFTNAAKFHNVKFTDFDAKTSSFNKFESYEDAFNMLTGYDNQIYIIRSKLEGVCRWLEMAGEKYAERHGIPKPAFINAGDGKHEHPTQELLDDFSFLERKSWDNSHIHIALIGDLIFGRTVHSKADGLKIFNEVETDLVAPEELQMPEHYVEKMNSNGFKVRIFHSIEEYLHQKHIAKDWYFTRPQLERMGDEILRRQADLRKAITFIKDYLSLVPDGTGFYHPLPRHKMQPTIPTWLDNTPFNQFERQSRNGYFIRIMLLGLIAGKIGLDFEGVPYKKREFVDDFVEEVNVDYERLNKSENQDVKPIANGVNIDHIAKGQSPEIINEHLERIKKVLKFNQVIGFGGVSKSKKDGKYKGFIALPDLPPLKEKQVKKLAALSPDCTVNIIENNAVKKKYRLHMPPRIYGFESISCKNEACISFPDHFENVLTEFHRAGSIFKCAYCEQPHSYKDIWRK